MGHDFSVIEAAAGAYRCLIGGEWQESSSGQLLDVFDPVEGKTFGQIQRCTPDEANRALEAAREAWPAWNEVSVSERATILHDAARLLRENQDELIDLLIHEIGKTTSAARSEVVRTADLVDYFAEQGLRYFGEIIWGDSFPGYSKQKLCLTWRMPVGVVLAIAPFNYPLNLSASKIAPALITGNACVYKPPRQGSIAACHMVELFREAGVPADVLSCITGKASEIGDVMTSHEAVDLISFTGGTRTGRHVAKVAGMAHLMMELGGKDAAIVLDDADLERATGQILKGAFSYGGQRCTGIKRVFATPGIADALVEGLVAGAKKMVVDDPRKEGTTYGPVISDDSADFIMELIQEAIEKGADCLCGNERSGRYIKPTVLDRVTGEMRIAWEEPFGPVLPIQRVDNLEEAIQGANASDYGLQSSIFTQDIDRAFEAGRRLEVGTVNINGKDSRGPDHFPFMGVKDSGIGTQGVHYSIQAMTQDRAIVLNLK